MPNFDLLLKRSMLLSDEVLVFYLTEFKEFLENLQVALGKIDAWLMETENCKAFLHEHFGKDSDFFELDNERYESSNFRGFDEKARLDKLKKIKCSRCDLLCSQHDANKSPGWVSCPCQKNEAGFFPLSLERPLLLCRLKGSLKMAFRIDEEADRKRLIKFLSFVTEAQTRNDEEEGHRQA